MTSNKLAAVNFTLASTTGAEANNTDTNDITATLIADGQDQYGIDISFSVTEPGVAFSNNAQTITAITNVWGNVLSNCIVRLKAP
jgi:hypothetical protein